MDWLVARIVLVAFVFVSVALRATKRTPPSIATPVPDTKREPANRDYTTPEQTKELQTENVPSNDAPPEREPGNDDPP